jgi:hypothetical protein
MSAPYKSLSQDLSAVQLQKTFYELICCQIFGFSNMPTKAKFAQDQLWPGSRLGQSHLSSALCGHTGGGYLHILQNIHITLGF